MSIKPLPKCVCWKLRRPVCIGVLFGCFGRKIAWRFLVYLVVQSSIRETHLFPLKGHLCLIGFGFHQEMLHGNKTRGLHLSGGSRAGQSIEVQFRCSEKREPEKNQNPSRHLRALPPAGGGGRHGRVERRSAGAFRLARCLTLFLAGSSRPSRLVMSFFSLRGEGRDLLGRLP